MNLAEVTCAFIFHNKLDGFLLPKRLEGSDTSGNKGEIAQWQEF